MPNREELACLMCGAKHCTHKPPGSDNVNKEFCLAQIEAADRVIEAGWKSPLECNKCIDEGAERVSDLIQHTVEAERKKVYDWIYSPCSDGKHLHEFKEVLRCDCPQVDYEYMVESLKGE